MPEEQAQKELRVEDIVRAARDIVVHPSSSRGQPLGASPETCTIKISAETRGIVSKVFPPSDKRVEVKFSVSGYSGRTSVGIISVQIILNTSDVKKTA